MSWYYKNIMYYDVIIQNYVYISHYYIHFLFYICVGINKCKYKSRYYGNSMYYAVKMKKCVCIPYYFIHLSLLHMCGYK